jgi:drug/metabolite transporter (DMT)-like permease
VSPPTYPRPANTLRGIVLMVASTCLFPVSDALGKHLIRDHGAVQILWVRHAILLAGVILVISAQRKLALFATRRLGLHALRTLATGAAAILMLSALRFIPLADATAIIFVGPLIVVALSVPMLGERVGAYRWSAVIVGFVGVLIIMRPGLGAMHWAAALALLSALAGALQVVLTRRLAATEHVFTTMFVMAAFSLALLTPLAPFQWTPLTLTTGALMALTAVISLIGQIGMIKAIEYAPISTLAPFSYFQIISATSIGFGAFGDLPDSATVAGLIVVVASGLFVAYRERALAGQRAGDTT